MSARFPAGRTAVVCAALVALAAAPRADELHLTDGDVVYGRLVEETRGGYEFHVVGEKRPDDFRRDDVARVVLTYALPAFVANDPQWSQQMVDARTKGFFADLDDLEVLRSEHYIVFTDSSAGDKYLETMEDIYDRFLELFPFEEQPDAPLMPVFLFRTNDGYYTYYQKIARVSRAAAAQSAGHAWKDYYATYYQSPKDPVNYHEGAHQLVGNRMHIRGGGSWFQEGMAVYYEGTIFPGEDPAKGIAGVLASDGYTPLREFVRLPSLLYSSESDADPSLGHRRYQQAGALIKFLKEGPLSEHWDDFLEAVRAGKRPAAIFESVYDMTVDEVDEAFVEYYS